MHGNEDDGYVVREHRKDDAVSASTLPIGGSVGREDIYLYLYGPRPSDAFGVHA